MRSTNPVTKSILQVLLVEDNASDARLMAEAFEEVNPDVRLMIAADVEQGLAMLRGLPPYPAPIWPALLLLDLNLPRVGGRELLVAAKNDPRLRSIPIVILTTSRVESDVRQCYEYYANSYVQKPLDFAALIETVRALDTFWLKTATRVPG